MSEDLKFTIKTTPYPDGKIIQDTTDFLSDTITKVINTQDAQFKEALFKLGWATPEYAQLMRDQIKEIQADNKRLNIALECFIDYQTNKGRIF